MCLRWELICGNGYREKLQLKYFHIIKHFHMILSMESEFVRRYILKIETDLILCERNLNFHAFITRNLCLKNTQFSPVISLVH